MSNCIKDLYDYDLVKKCSKCGIVKLKSNFNKDITKKDGYRPSCKICCQNYYYINQDRILNNHKIYSKNIRSKINAYERQKRLNDCNFKLGCKIRGRTNRAFKSQNVRNINKTFDLIGCSDAFLRKWIIHQLYGDMTLENYGKIWCLDHTYPLSKTSLSNQNDMYKYTNWINIRPMYIKDNIIKSDKIDNWLLLMQEVKAKYFIKLNGQEGVD